VLKAIGGELRTQTLSRAADYSRLGGPPIWPGRPPAQFWRRCASKLRQARPRVVADPPHRRGSEHDRSRNSQDERLRRCAARDPPLSPSGRQYWRVRPLCLFMLAWLGQRSSRLAPMALWAFSHPNSQPNPLGRWRLSRLAAWAPSWSEAFSARPSPTATISRDECSGTEPLARSPRAMRFAAVPHRWPESFALVMIEALACPTRVALSTLQLGGC
jgi:hypothetical protein